MQSNSHQKYNKEQPGSKTTKHSSKLKYESNPKQVKNDRLKRSKSEDKDEEYEYIIEEYTESYKKSRRDVPKDKPKLIKTKSTAQPSYSTMSRFTTDQKFSYKQSDHDD